MSPSIPTTPQTVLTTPETVPTTPEIVPTTPETVPTTPETINTTPETLPTTPEAVPTTPHTVTTIPITVPTTGTPTASTSNPNAIGPWCEDWTVLPPIQDQICLQVGIKKPFYSVLGNHYCQHTCLFKPMDLCNLYLCYCNTKCVSSRNF